MLDHLWTIWKRYLEGGKDGRWLSVEGSQWLSQYSVSADDFAFSLGVSLLRYSEARARS